ncbi:MAG: glycosyltransferase family 4 protein [Planctomycetes bacterium]|nr:glycosyltransferase family 4 protein [Planctomycetota bacterium]
MGKFEKDVVLVGHPFISTGMGEHLRVFYRSMKAAWMKVGVLNIFDHYRGTDDKLYLEFHDDLVGDLHDNVNVFFINGDEIEPHFAHRKFTPPTGAHNIIAPAWELSNYPAVWARQLEAFDEVWALSTFTADSIRKAVSIPVKAIPDAVEPKISNYVSRRYFGIQESSFVFMFSFDFTSYIERKNPYAVLDAFKIAARELGFADIRLVIKLNGTAQRPDDFIRFTDAISEYKERVTIIDKVLSANEMKNLIRVCDCYVSLHRSEGFGFGMAEAMYFGKPVIGTGYSGNLDFMNDENSLLVPYKLVDVPDGAYPYSANQQWAEPDVHAAAEYMISLATEPSLVREVGERASRFMRVHFSYRTKGIECRDAFSEVGRLPKSVTSMK